MTGCAGSGKTTLAREVGAQLEVRHIERDALGDDEAPGFAALVAAAVEAVGRRWVFDGAPYNAEARTTPRPRCPQACRGIRVADSVRGCAVLDVVVPKAPQGAVGPPPARSPRPGAVASLGPALRPPCARALWPPGRRPLAECRVLVDADGVGESRGDESGAAIMSALPQEEFDAIFAKVPRLTVEVVITSRDGVLLTRRQSGPCQGLWHLPGGTVRLGEPLTEAVARVARQELGLKVEVGELLGYIEYPSHLRSGLGWPVGVAFRVSPSSPDQLVQRPPSLADWFSRLPDEMHYEQREFLATRVLGPQKGSSSPACRR